MDVHPTIASILSGPSEPDEASGAEKRTAGGTGTSRLEKVSAKDFCDFKSTHQLLSVMYNAIVAHRILLQDAGILHGDINPNTIVTLETEDGKVEGGLVDYDMPLCRAAVRKLEKPDPAVPPRQRERYLPAYY